MAMDLLYLSCVILLEHVSLLWDELRQLIWGTYNFVASNLDEVILEYGHGLGLAADMLYSPQHSYIQSGCPCVSRGLCLKKSYCWKVVLYTLGCGAIPAYSINLYCKGVSSLLRGCHYILIHLRL
jgi:hypothetical protein